MNLPTALRYLDQHTNLEATAGRAEAECLAGAAAVAPAATTAVSPLVLRLKIGFYFGLWYALNIYYNSYVSLSGIQ